MCLNFNIEDILSILLSLDEKTNRVTKSNKYQNLVTE
jgi:hypothetical protein